jgi:hypothetical protein
MIGTAPTISNPTSHQTARRDRHIMPTILSPPSSDGRRRAPRGIVLKSKIAQ